MPLTKLLHPHKPRIALTQKMHVCPTWKKNALTEYPSIFVKMSKYFIHSLKKSDHITSAACIVPVLDCGQLQPSFFL